MDATTMFGGAAIFTTIGLVWDKIKFFFSRMTSLFIVTAKIDGMLPKAMEIYCLKNFKKSPFQPLSFGSFKEYVKKNKKHQHIAYEEVNLRSKVVFWDGWKPIMLQTSGGRSDGGPEAQGKESTSTISFFRGTFDIENIFVQAINLFNERSVKSQKRIRFRIQKHFGCAGNRENNNQARVASPSMEKSPYGFDVDVFLGDKKILGFDINEIGDNEDNSRNLSVLAFPKEIDTLVEEIERWKNSEDWYISKSIPWKRGLLLYSSPGCGKTSLVKALGQYLDLPIHVFDLASMSNYDFTNSWEDMLGNTPCIALVEDVDAVFVGRENVRNKNNNMDLLTFDCFLNNIDGVQNTDGLFLVVTTNRVDVLDEALGKPRTGNVNGSRISTRPGRIDRAFELKTMDRDCRMKVAKRILSDCPVEMIEKIVDSSEQYSGAQVVEICTQTALKYFWEHKK